MSDEKKRPVYEGKTVQKVDGRNEYKRFANVWRNDFDDGGHTLSIQLLLREDVRDERYEISIEDVVDALRAARDAGEKPPFFTNLDLPYHLRQKGQQDERPRGRGVQSQSQVRRRAEQKPAISDDDFDVPY